MADNNRISIKKTSRVLAITCVTYTTVATILYNNYQIDLIDYSTPVILGTVATIMSCAALQRLFCSLLSKSYLSFGCKELSSRGTVPSETNPDTQEELPPTDNATSEKQVESPYLKEYEARIEELRRNEMEKKTAIVHAIHEYTTHEMSQFLSIDDLETLHENIESLAYGKHSLLSPEHTMFRDSKNGSNITSRSRLFAGQSEEASHPFPKPTSGIKSTKKGRSGGVLFKKAD